MLWYSGIQQSTNAAGGNGIRGGLTMEEGAMMMMTESTNVPFGGVGKGDGDCNGNDD